MFTERHEGNFATLTPGGDGPRRRRLARPDGGPLGGPAARLRPSLREPRRRGRRDALAPARPDLRLRAPAALDRAARRRARGGPGAHGILRLLRRRRRRAGAPTRIVHDDPHWAVGVPFAPRWPYEVHVRAIRHGARRLTDLTAAESRALAGALHAVVARYNGLFGFELPVHDGRPRGAARSRGLAPRRRALPAPSFGTAYQDPRVGRDLDPPLHQRHAARGERRPAAGRRRGSPRGAPGVRGGPRRREARDDGRAGRPRRAEPGSSGRRAGSTSSASTPTTTWASCCRRPSTSRSGSPSSRPTTAGSSSSARPPGSARRSTSTRSARTRAGWPATWPGPPGRSPRPGSRPGASAGTLTSTAAPGVRALVLGGARAGLGVGAGRAIRRRRSRSELARICQRAENAYVGVNCGLMDQFASACGVAGAGDAPRLPLARLAAGGAAARHAHARGDPHRLARAA